MKKWSVLALLLLLLLPALDAAKKAKSKSEKKENEKLVEEELLSEIFDSLEEDIKVELNKTKIQKEEDVRTKRLEVKNIGEGGAGFPVFNFDKKPAEERPAIKKQTQPPGQKSQNLKSTTAKPTSQPEVSSMKKKQELKQELKREPKELLQQGESAQILSHGLPRINPAWLQLSKSF